jgi:hypothetical protein
MTISQQGDERYSKASKRLRKTLGNDKAYEAANAWALKLCAEAEQFDWPDRPSPTKTRDTGKLAAKLADHLESGRLREHMEAAEQQSGIKLGLDAASLAKYLRALAEQCEGGDIWLDWLDWLSCGPLRMRFTNKNQKKMPPKATAIAVALTYGFRRIPDCVKSNRSFEPRFHGQFPRDGQPCLAAAVLFANAALKKEVMTDDATDDAVAALKQWMKNNKGRFRYGGF